jgi:hypothetical protein
MAWMDIAVSTAGILWGGVGGTDAGRELLSGIAETDSEASYGPRAGVERAKKGAHSGRHLPALETAREIGGRPECLCRQDQTGRGGC